MEEPWRSDRFSKFVKKEITKYWANLLQKSASTYQENTLNLLNITELDLSVPHRIWKEADNEAISVQKATIVSWFFLGVYKTQERLYKMKKVFSPNCLLCQSPPQHSDDSVHTESRSHLALQCVAFSEIRKNYFDKFIAICPVLATHMDTSDKLLKILLDPLSSDVPIDIREGWSSQAAAYEISRNYFYALHKKHTKLMEKLEQTTRPIS